MRKTNGNNGSELHRLKPMRDYDEAMFNRLYKVCKPVIRNLTKQIDYKRFNLTPDIISSYFWDKMLFVLISTTVLVVKNILKQESYHL